MTRIVLFCGGRGSASIIRALLRQPDVELTLLVNAYDDGQSTGALRSFMPGMLGPSDFRKNLYWLLSHDANSQYALRNLMEYRLPAATAAAQAQKLARFSQTGDAGVLDAPLKDWFAEQPSPLAARLRALLVRFFDHAASAAFDYRDCALGNLVFAGAYLACGNDFNAAIGEVAALMQSRARLLNVAEAQDRVLVGLKQDGTLLACEAQIVGPQSPAPIDSLYLLKQALTEQERRTVASLDTAGKQAFLAARNATPALSAQAAEAIAQADIILYGPGTQHSSLLPSYRIAAAALAKAPAPVKALTINLDTDSDIQGFSVGDIVDRALVYGAPVTEILLDQNCGLAPLHGESYRGAKIVRGAFTNAWRPGLHNGAAVVNHLLGKESRGNSMASICAVIPAAGRGTRLGTDLPKVFAPLSETQTVWSVLQGKLSPVVDHIHLVLSPEGAQHAPAGISFSIQPQPIGMGDAIFRGHDVWSDYDAILVVWGDQVFVSPDTLARAVAALKPGRRAVLPVTRQPQPYVEYLFNEGHLAQVLQSREGDATSPNGFSDVGTFLLNTEGLKTAWQAFLASAPRGAGTGEINFLPFLPFLSREGWAITSLEVADATEARGINTPEDLAFFRDKFR